VDGWNGAEFVFRALNNSQDERRAKRCVILLRKMQIEKIAASVALSYHSDVDLISDRLWGDIESELRKILLSNRQIEYLVEGSRQLHHLVGAASAVPGLCTSHARETAAYQWRSQATTEEVKQQVRKLTEVLDLEAKLIGQCADILTDFITSRRKNREASGG
jgi:hypothetical protein